MPEATCTGMRQVEVRGGVPPHLRKQVCAGFVSRWKDIGDIELEVVKGHI